jgi:hypothetical protein
MRDTACHNPFARVLRRDVILTQRHLHACRPTMPAREAGDTIA